MSTTLPPSLTTVTPPKPADVPLSPFETGPDTPAGRFLRSYWQPVRVGADLPAGKAEPLHILDDHFTLYRGEDGVPQVTAPGCPHRLTRLAVGTVEGGAIRCLFHGWKFAADGQCLEAPGQGDAVVKRTRLKTYPTREEHGLIFAYFGEGDPPPFYDIDAFSKKYGKDMLSARFIHNSTYHRDCNYYVNVENVVDLAHVPYTHALSSSGRATAEIGFDSKVREIRDITVERTDIGVRANEVDDKRQPTLQMVMLPNAMHLVVAKQTGTMEQVAWRVPINNDYHVSFQIVAHFTDEEGERKLRENMRRRRERAAKFPPPHVCAEQVLSGEKSMTDFADHPMLINIEDGVAQQGMRFIADPNQENLAQSDKGVIQLRRMFMSRLTQFESGAPTDVPRW